MNFGAIIGMRVAIVPLLLLSSVGLATAGPCPGPNKTPHHDGTYDFTYESWVKKYENRDHWDFGRCVENKLATKEMYVDWKNTGVLGWAKPKDKVDSAVESPSPDYDLLPTDLWYGAGPTKIDAPYREKKPEQKVTPDVVKSRVHMAVPEDAKRAAETLVSIEVEFTSEVSPDAEGLKYRYSWSDALAKDRAPVRFRWEGLTLLLSTTGTRPPEQLRLTADRFEVSFVTKTPPAYAVTLVEFLDRDGKTVVGTAPVATYHPSGVNLPPLPKYDGAK